jgi:hypothetical protein
MVYVNSYNITTESCIPETIYIERVITRGSLGRTVQSGRAGPGLDVYKTGLEVLGFSFLRSTPIY